MQHTLMLGYVGPEVVLPVTSAIAAMCGFFLMMGRTGLSYLLGLVKRQPVREAVEHEAERHEDTDRNSAGQIPRP